MTTRLQIDIPKVIDARSTRRLAIGVGGKTRSSGGEGLAIDGKERSNGYLKMSTKS